MTWRALLALAATALALAACAGPPGRIWVREGFAAACPAAPAFAEAAAANAASLDGPEVAPFGAPEPGWRIYAPAIAAETGARCGPESAGFAQSLALWQSAHGLAADGRMGPALLDTFKAQWQARRPFLHLRAEGLCPDPPEADRLAPVPAADAAKGSSVLLEADALAAFRRLRAAARRDLGLVAGDETLAVFSGFRAPAYDAERCTRQGDCDGIGRAECSAHRTGRALDLVLALAPGWPIDSTAAPNRRFQTASPAYRWLLVNARRFGFVNYAYEPWHWEWAGPPSSSPSSRVSTAGPEQPLLAPQ